MHRHYQGQAEVGGEEPDALACAATAQDGPCHLYAEQLLLSRCCVSGVAAWLMLFQSTPTHRQCLCVSGDVAWTGQCLCLSLVPYSSRHWCVRTEFLSAERSSSLYVKTVVLPRPAFQCNISCFSHMQRLRKMNYSGLPWNACNTSMQFMHEHSMEYIGAFHCLSTLGHWGRRAVPASCDVTFQPWTHAGGLALVSCMWSRCSMCE